MIMKYMIGISIYVVCPVSFPHYYVCKIYACWHMRL